MIGDKGNFRIGTYSKKSILNSKFHVRYSSFKENASFLADGIKTLNIGKSVFGIRIIGGKRELMNECVH